MKLTLKLTAALTVAILLVLGINAFLRVRREVRALEEDVQRDGHVFGRALAGAVSRIWVRVGEREALDLVADANERESHVTIRWVWLDADSQLGGDDASRPVVPAAELSGLANGRPRSVRYHAAGAEPALYTYVRAELPVARRGAIEIAESLAAERAITTRIIGQGAIATTSLVLLCALIATGLGAVFVGRPVRRLVAQARRIGAGDLSGTIAVQQRDEIGDLAYEMNVMCAQLAAARADLERETSARLATLEQLRHADRLATVGKLGAGVAHEIGTPLNVIRGYAQLLTEDPGIGANARESAGIIAQQVDRVANIVRQLLDFARRRTPRKELVDLDQLASQAVSLLGKLASTRNVELRVSTSGGVLVSIDPTQLGQVLTNLLVNAIQATSEATENKVIDVRTEARNAMRAGDVEERAYGCVSVRDRGVGIAPDVLPRLFEPFFTTKDVGEGTGLGLSVAYGIVEEHGGFIDVESEPGVGSCFSVFLPLAKPETEGV